MFDSSSVCLSILQKILKYYCNVCKVYNNAPECTRTCHFKASNSKIFWGQHPSRSIRRWEWKPTPLGAYGASILVPLALATRWKILDPPLCVFCLSAVLIGLITLTIYWAHKCDQQWIIIIEQYDGGLLRLVQTRGRGAGLAVSNIIKHPSRAHIIRYIAQTREIIK